MRVDNLAASPPGDWMTDRLDRWAHVISTRMSYSEMETLTPSTSEDACMVLGVKVSDMNRPGNETTLSHSGLMVPLERAVAERRCAPPGTIIFPKRGAAIATNKKRLALKWTAFDPNIIGIVARGEVDRRFLFYWFQCFDLRTITEPGPTPQLNKKNLEPLIVSVPKSRDEQRAIADVLNQAQAAAEVERRSKRTAQDLKRAAMHELFTRGLSGQPPTETENGLVPYGWTSTEIGSLGDLVTGTTPATKDSGNYVGGTVSFIAPGDFEHGTRIVRTEKLITDQGLSLSRALPSGATCFVCIGSTIGKVGITTESVCATNQQINAVVPSAEFDRNFVFHLMTYCSEYIRRQASPSPVPILSKGAFERIQVFATRDMEEQKKISTILDGIDRKIDLHERKQAVLDLLFRTLLVKLINADIRTSDIDMAVLGPTAVPESPL